ncbi:MAG: hypothetical protein A3G34_09065 [Candidatus Lindowbacteria bacterium RIFCSPLOWO2_12_FULL_62_27]|nr:MAG: hypothetical protein A3G34_09065 [Candidatus Lindowbacteria bacterium RIFCSPLOWO2_12_FULL_62_27]
MFELAFRYTPESEFDLRVLFLIVLLFDPEYKNIPLLELKNVVFPVTVLFELDSRRIPSIFELAVFPLMLLVLDIRWMP